MENPTGESVDGPLRLGFDRWLIVQFRGSLVTSDAGLLAYRELDVRWVLALWQATASPTHAPARTVAMPLVGLPRQSVFGRLAGYEDVNDAERLRHDPAMRWIVGGKASQGYGASPSQMFRDAVACGRKEPVGARPPLGPMDRPCKCSSPASSHRARYGFQRQSDPLRAGDERLERPLRMHLLSSVVRVQPVWRSGTLFVAARQCSQRRRLEGCPGTGRTALSRRGITHLFPC